MNTLITEKRYLVYSQLNFSNLLILIFLLFGTTIFSQPKSNPPLAEFTGGSVFMDEFVNRFQLYPNLNNQHDIDSLKNDFLYNIITEKLFAKEVKLSNFNNNKILTYKLKFIREMYLRDIVYQKEITDSIFITETELQKAYKKSLNIPIFNFIYSADSIEIKKQYHLLNKELSIEKNIDNIFLPFFPDRVIELQYGYYNQNTESILYDLKEGEYTTPIPYENGWYIFYKRSTKNFVFSENFQPADQLSSVRKILFKRKQNKIYNSFKKNFFSNRKVEVSSDEFDTIVTKIKNVLETSIPKKNEYFFKQSELEQILMSADISFLQTTFFQTENVKVSIEEFLFNLAFEAINFSNFDYQTVFRRIDSKTKDIIEWKLLAEYGRKKGYDILIQKNYEIWESSTLSKFYLEHLRKEFSEKYAEKNQEVAVQEILINDLETAEIILDSLSIGADFDNLAKNYNKNSINNYGFLGYLNKNDYPPIGEIAQSLLIGEIYGPVKVDSGYSIIRIMDVAEKIKENEFSNFVNQRATELAAKFILKVNENILSKTNIVNQQMLVYKYFGFGGRMLAYPLTPQINKWSNQWKTKTEIP